MKEIPLSKALLDAQQIRERWLEAIQKCKYNPKWLAIANLYWARLKCYRSRIERAVNEYAHHSATWKWIVDYDHWLDTFEERNN